MANPWFKFYAADYLNEVKLKGVSSDRRSCLVTALCYAAVNEGVIDTRYMTSDILKIEAGVKLGGSEWDECGDVYEWLVEREIGVMQGHLFSFKNWFKRQESYLTGAERVRKHRANVTDVTLEENREDKNRKETAHRDWLTDIPPETVKELSEKYEASTSQVKRKGEELLNYCLAKGKTYKNYRAFLENALNKDFGRRPPKKETPIEKPVHLDPEAQRRVDELKGQISSKFRITSPLT